MGYGLVAIPRQLWRIANIKGAEKASFHKAGLQADRAIAAKRCSTGCSMPYLRGIALFSQCRHVALQDSLKTCCP